MDQFAEFGQFTALQPFCKQWDAMLGVAREDKQKKFGRDAALCEKYYVGNHNFVFGRTKDNEGNSAYAEGESPDVSPPVFKVTFNKVAELVQLFGPLLYHRNPTRQVRPRKDWRPPDLLLQAQQQAQAPPAPPQGPPQGPLSGLMSQMAQGPPDQSGQPPAPPPPDPNQQFDLDDAQNQARASLLEALLNYTPDELDLKEEMRLSIDEGLVTGRGCMWTELYEPPGGGTKLVGTFFKSVRSLLIDPDVTRLKDAKWISEDCTHPTWEVERMYGHPPGSFGNKGLAESTDVKASVETTNAGSDAKKQGRSADLMRYKKIWSKMGMGHRLKSTKFSQAMSDDAAASSEAFGDYVYLVIAPNVPYPLNLKPELAEKYFGEGGAERIQQAQLGIQAQQQYEQAMAQYQQMTAQPMPGMQPPPPPPEPDQALMQAAQEVQDMQKALEWPIPFWADDEWPMTEIDFHPLANSAWPMPHMKPALGEQNFLDWGYSFLAGHIREACRTFIAVLKSAGEEIKTSIVEGRDLTVLELEPLNKTIAEVVQFLQMPPLNADVMNILQKIELSFEKRTGLSEMMYGQSATQSRSAQDAQTKASAMQIRPDDMAERVEQAAKKIARKEGIAARLLLKGEDVAAILGPAAAQFWDQYVASDDPIAVSREFDYRLEASSARKPNKERDIANTQEALQVIVPALQQIAQQYGEWKPLLQFFQDWAKARDFDVQAYQLDPAHMQQLQQQAAQQAQQQQMAQQQAKQQPAQGPPPNGQAPPQPAAA